MRWLAALCLLPLVGCGASAAIARLETALELQLDELEAQVAESDRNFSIELAAQQDLLETGVITRSQFDAEVGVLKEERGQAMQIAVDTAKVNSKVAAQTAVEEVKESVARSQATAARAAKIGGSILIPGSSGIWDSLIAAGVGMFGLNTYRNRTRKKDLTKVASETA